MTDKKNNTTSCREDNSTAEIDQILFENKDVFFTKELKIDNSTAVINRRTIKKNNDPETADIPDEQWMDAYAKKLRELSSPFTWEYHKSEIENVNKIINTILSLIKWVSFLTIIIVAVFSFYNKNSGAIISLITGGFVDAILGVLAGMFNSTLKSKKSYFDAESESSKFDKMLFLIHTISDSNLKDEVISEVVRNHFNINAK